ncbi:MAG: hypothetical protein K2W96_23180 [Gemmataceae bacterium]|nr:hypothetical protein [Gemmataceae bacterium]
MTRFKRAEPFKPFVVELSDGRIIRYATSDVGFGPHGASYPTEGDELSLDGFRREEVREIRADSEGQAMMGPEEFYETMTRFKRAEPFMPFVVELHDGRTIRIDKPNVGVGPDGAVWLTGGADMVIHDFDRDEVRAIRRAEQEIAR